ncbi:myeloid differentiation primary response protein MyD88-like [Argopecten irradians]|uniref:myeloid differentiation primary response protein MyD88-like n=1 Tax=Argopecten irradians TaxID=31199 RepID=UPI0037235BEA
MPGLKIQNIFGKKLKDIYKYDAYVSHGTSERDRTFARMLAKTLEQAPYNFRLFLPDDEIIDKTNVKVISDTIKNRCKRLLLVMSEDYAADRMSDFTVQVAMTKANYRKDRIIIPLVIDRNCELPPVISHLTSADFTMRESAAWILPRVESALKAPVSNT